MYKSLPIFAQQKVRTAALIFSACFFFNTAFADPATNTGNTTTTAPQTSDGFLGLGTVSGFVGQGVQSGKDAIAQTQQVQQQAQQQQAAAAPSQGDMQDLVTFLNQNPQVAQNVANQMGQTAQTDNTQSAPAQTQDQNTQSSAATSQAMPQTQMTSNGQPVPAAPILNNQPPQTAADVPKTPWQPANDQEALDNAMAYRSVTQSAFPLSPEQIQQLRNYLDATQRAAAAAPYNAPPTPTSTSLNINLSPGATPPAIRLAKGFVSSLVFIDSTGAPWPIESYDIGDPQTFNIQWNKKSNTLMIQAQKDYNYGNLAVKLDKLNTPVMLTLIPGQQVVDYRVDLRVDGLGPNALPSIEGTGLPDQANPKLLDVLNGMAPKGSVRLTVDGDLAQAWVLGDDMYFRTRFTVLSPAWISKMSSADGMNAYEMQKAPMVLVMRHGKVIPVKIEGLS